VGSHYEVTNGVVTKYYFAGATRLAVRTNGTLSYLLGDHLGSSSVTTNASGVKTASALYKAFGETRYSSGALGTDYKFTGQREEASIGLYFYGARWYDSSLGRFTSADTMIPSAQGVQAWDRYAYANNNPVRYNDPTGHSVTQGDGGSSNCTYANNYCDSGTPPAPTATPTPTCIPGPSNCSATQAAAPTATATPTATPGCPVGQTCIGNPQPTSTPNPTTTPMFYNEVNAVSDYCFGAPDLSGAPGCGQLVDMGAQGVGFYMGFQPGQIPPVGDIFDKVVAGSNFFGGLDTGNMIQNIKANPELDIIFVIAILYLPIFFIFP